MYKIFLLFIFSLAIYSCQPEARPINYGTDECDYCRMTVVDNQYAAEMVNNNSKVFVFDAAECMIRFLETNNESGFALILVSDYNRPGQLIDARAAFFIRSAELPSPMGMYITAVPTENEVKELQNKHGGDLFTFESLKNNFSSLAPL